MEHSHEYNQVVNQIIADGRLRLLTLFGSNVNSAHDTFLSHTGGMLKSHLVCCCVNIYPCTGIERMLLMLANIVLKWSGSFLKPISVSTRDWLMSWMKNTNSVGVSPLKTVTDLHLFVRRGSAQLLALYSILLWYRLHLVDWLQTAALQSGETCSDVRTFLSGHLDGFPVAEGSFAFPRCVHFVFDAAVDDPKLYLRQAAKINVWMEGYKQNSH